MFNLNEKYGCRNYKKDIDVYVVQKLIEKFTKKPELRCFVDVQKHTQYYQGI